MGQHKKLQCGNTRKGSSIFYLFILLKEGSSIFVSIRTMNMKMIFLNYKGYDIYDSKSKQPK